MMVCLGSLGRGWYGEMANWYEWYMTRVTEKYPTEVY